MTFLLSLACVSGPWVVVGVHKDGACVANAAGELACKGPAPLSKRSGYLDLDGDSDSLEVCGLTLDGVVVCEEGGFWSRSGLLPTEGGFTAVDVGAYGGAATGPDGTVCWNDALPAATCHPEPLLDMVFGEGWGLGIEVDGTLVAWGMELPLEARALVGVQAVATHINGNTFLVGADDGVFRWDVEDIDQPGFVLTTLSTTPAVRLETTRTTLACDGTDCSYAFTWCALDAEGRATCAGLGEDDAADGLQATPPDRLVDFDLGDGVGCAVTGGGEVRCWGVDAPADWSP